MISESVRRTQTYAVGHFETVKSNRLHIAILGSARVEHKRAACRVAIIAGYFHSWTPANVDLPALKGNRQI